MISIVYSRSFPAIVLGRSVALLGAPNGSKNRMVGASHENDVREVDLP